MFFFRTQTLVDMAQSTYSLKRMMWRADSISVLRNSFISVHPSHILPSKVDAGSLFSYYEGSLAESVHMSSRSIAFVISWPSIYVITCCFLSCDYLIVLL